MSRGHWFVRWAYYFNEEGIPKTSSVCTLFWRGCVLNPLFVAVILFIIGGAIYITYRLFTDQGWSQPRIAVTVNAILLSGIGIFLWILNSEIYGLFVQWLKDFKDRKCTKICLE
jgi:hypothetical protein